MISGLGAVCPELLVGDARKIEWKVRSELVVHWWGMHSSEEKGSTPSYDSGKVMWHQINHD